MAKVLVRCDPVSHQLLDPGKLRKTLLAAVPDDDAFDADHEHASGAGNQSDLAEFLFEGRQQLLGNPGGS